MGATAVRVASGISPGTLEERDPDMSRVTSVISVLSPPQVPESGRTCGARCPIAAVVRAVRAPAARAGHVGVPPPAGWSRLCRRVRRPGGWPTPGLRNHGPMDMPRRARGPRAPGPESLISC